MSESAPLPPSSPARRRWPVVVIAALAALLVAALVVIGILWFARGGESPAVAASPTASAMTSAPSSPAASPTAAANAGRTPSSAGSSPSATATGSPDQPDPRHGIFTDVSVQREGSEACGTSHNVPLIARATASGSALWFGVDTTDAEAEPFTFWNNPNGEQTVTGFVYDCSRDSEQFTFTFEDDLGQLFSKTVVLRTCEGRPSPRESCSG